MKTCAKPGCENPPVKGRNFCSRECAPLGWLGNTASTSPLAKQKAYLRKKRHEIDMALDQLMEASRRLVKAHTAGKALGAVIDVEDAIRRAETARNIKLEHYSS